MGPAEVFPEVPANLEKLLGEDQARILVKAGVEGAQSFSKCELNRQALIEWIKSTPVKAGE